MIGTYIKVELKVLNNLNFKLDEIYNYFNDEKKIYTINDISQIKSLLLTKYSKNKI